MKGLKVGVGGGIRVSQFHHADVACEVLGVCPRKPSKANSQHQGAEMRGFGGVTRWEHGVPRPNEGPGRTAALSDANTGGHSATAGVGHGVPGRAADPGAGRRRQAEGR